MLVIKNGNVLVEDTLKKVDILIDEGKIVKIAENIEGDHETIDASGLTVLPGLVDVHVHLREPGHAQKETIKTGTKAAAAGGFTTVLCMPNVIPFPDNVEDVKNYLELIHDQSVVNTYPYACITKKEAGKEVVDMHALKALGIHWFSDDGVGVANDEIMKEAMTKANQEDVMIVAHTEDMSYRKPGACVHESEITKAKGWLGIPSACESAQLIRDLEIVKECKNAYHACHISAKESVEALKKAKNDGLNVSGEVTAHHLLLEDKDVQGPNWKMNPPLRTEEDRRAIIEAIADGTIEVIATDHAPHSEEEKAREFAKAPSGIIGLETSFAAGYTYLVKPGHLTISKLIERMTADPARLYGLNAGTLSEGAPADIVLIDTEEEWLVTDDFASKSKNSPYIGETLTGKVKMTICGAYRANAVSA